MTILDPSLTRLVVLLTLAALYAPIIVFTVRQRHGQEGAAWLVVLYSLSAMALNLADAFWEQYYPSAAQSFHEVDIAVALALAFIVLMVAQIFLRRAMWWMWFGLGMLWALALTGIYLNSFNLPETIWTNGTLILPRERLAPAVCMLGWLIFTLGAIVSVGNGIRHARQPLYRNRLNYWIPPFLLMIANDLALFADSGIIGSPLRPAIALLMAYVVCTHDLPDLRQIVRRVVIYTITTLLVVGLYVAGFYAAQVIFRNSPRFNPLITGAALSLLLALIFSPLLGGVRRLVGIWMNADRYNTGQTLHEYSQSISNILDMDKLADVVVGITLDTMRIQRGFLFLVDNEPEADGRRIYRLRSARSPEERQMVAIELDADGPIASYLTREQRPLLQYDLDLLPLFRPASTVEREWFNQLQSEVYVPILAKKQWIGMLAFGSKLSGNRYTEEDLVTLSALANQTAVALENARLVDNLLILNNELRQARRALEKSNRDLERLDQAKSDFISIASHELRTPLTVIKGYTEMLLEDSALDENIRALMKGIHDGTLRMSEVTDSMFDLAQIDARSMKPHLQSVELSELIQQVCTSQEKTAKERKQTLAIDLPPLPHVKADSNLLRKLFQNVIGNAIKFTPDSGLITVTGIAIPSIVDMPAGAVEIIVSDTGVGVDPDFREIIFTKFYQPSELGKHSTSKKRFKGGGAGLGLALSKGIVEAHGGRIWVESPGYDEIHFPGSQFHVLLPLTKTEKGEAINVSNPLKVSYQ